MTEEHRRPARAAVAVLAGFALGAWLGSARTIRRIRHLRDPKNRRWLKQQLKRPERRRKAHTLRRLFR